jgi:hypothetical protein
VCRKPVFFLHWHPCTAICSVLGMALHLSPICRTSLGLTFSSRRS